MLSKKYNAAESEAIKATCSCKNIIATTGETFKVTVEA